MQFLAKEYKTRKDLEAVIAAEAGLDIQVNREAGHTIEGSVEELKALHLSDSRTVFGVRVVVSKEEDKAVNKRKIKPVGKPKGSK